MSTDAWHHSPDRAAYDARHEPQAKGVLPHWLRCDHYRGDARCVRKEGHGGEHQAGKGEQLDNQEK